MPNQNLRHRPELATFDMLSDDIYLEVFEHVSSTIHEGTRTARAQREPVDQLKNSPEHALQLERWAQEEQALQDTMKNLSAVNWKFRLMLAPQLFRKVTFCGAYTVEAIKPFLQVLEQSSKTTNMFQTCLRELNFSPLRFRLNKTKGTEFKSSERLMAAFQTLRALEHLNIDMKGWMFEGLRSGLPKQPSSHFLSLATISVSTSNTFILSHCPNVHTLLLSAGYVPIKGGKPNRFREKFQKDMMRLKGVLETRKGNVKIINVEYGGGGGTYYPSVLADMVAAMPDVENFKLLTPTARGTVQQLSEALTSWPQLLTVHLPHPWNLFTPEEVLAYDNYLMEQDAWQPCERSDQLVCAIYMNYLVSLCRAVQTACPKIVDIALFKQAEEARHEVQDCCETIRDAKGKITGFQIGYLRKHAVMAKPTKKSGH